MFIARFITGPGTDKTPYNVQITFWEYIQYLVNQEYFLKKLGAKYHKDFFSGFYFAGCIWKF